MTSIAAAAQRRQACRRPSAGAALAERIARVRDHLAAHPEDPCPLAELARLAGLSPGHLQRAFTAAMGMSPRRWHLAHRERLLRAGLRDDDVSGAIFAAGYGSGSRVYTTAGRRLGMTPGRYARGGAGVAISYAIAASPYGRLLIAASDHGVCAVHLGNADAELLHLLNDEFPRATITRSAASGSDQLRSWIAWVVERLGGTPVGGSEPPLAPRGSGFQIQVWELLRRIPRGETRSYTQVASALGRPGSARAVARACASNPLAILIPCHRVIRGDGDLAGYRWGLERKRRLLAAERTLGA